MSFKLKDFKVHDIGEYGMHSNVQRKNERNQVRCILKNYSKHIVSLPLCLLFFFFFVFETSDIYLWFIKFERKYFSYVENQIFENL